MSQQMTFDEHEWLRKQAKAAVAPKGKLLERRRELQKFTTEMLERELGK